MFAISSRANNTSSSGGPSKTFWAEGGSSRLRSAGSCPSPLMETRNIAHRCQSSSSPRPAAPTHTRSPKTFVTAIPRTRTTEPAGAVNGTMNQSLA
jgi:hypothetical protein